MHSPERNCIIQGVGNNIYFLDPYSVEQLFTDVVVGGVTAGAINGVTALKYGRSFWNGKIGDLSPLPSINVNSVPLKHSDMQVNGQQSSLQKPLPDQPTLYKVQGADGNFQYTAFEPNPAGIKKNITDITNIGRDEFLSRIPGLQQSPMNPNMFIAPNGSSFYIYPSSNLSGNLPSIQYNNGNGILKTLRFYWK